MGGKKMTVSVEAGENDWVKLNPGQSGFYRVAYPPDMMKRLTGAAQELPTVDRLGLLDDAFALARAGYIKTSTALELLDAYKYERNFSVWMTVASAAGSMNNLLYGEPRYPELKVYLRNLFGIIAGRLGWKKLPTDTHLDVLLRSLALRNFGGYGNRATINTAEAKFEEFIATGELDPDLRQTVYSLVAENNGQKALEALMKIYDSTDMHEEKVRILRSMGSFSDKETVKEVLKFSFSEKVRSQDGPILLISVGMNPANRKATWEFVKKNWKKLLDRYERGGLGLMTRLLEVTAGFTKEEELKDVSAFFKTHRFPGADRTMKQSLEMIKSNIAWLNRDREDIKQWLADGRTDG
jgi:puromycin-sensitive aminopeptidase